MIYLILFFGVFLRLWNLNQSFWLDEAINVFAVRENSLSQLVTQYALGDFHPPLYHVVLFFWTRLFGFSEVATRMLSVTFGVATVFLCFSLFKRIFSKFAVVLATLFLATSPLHIYYSQEARMYAFTAFFALLSVYFFIKIIRDGVKAQKNIWLPYFFSTLFLLYSEYLPYFLVLSQNIIIFWQREKIGKKTIKKWIMTQLLLFACLLPWFPFLWRQLQIALHVAREFTLWNQVVGQATLQSIAILPIKFLIGRISLTDKVLYGLLVSPLLLCIGGLSLRFFLKERGKKHSLILFLLFLLPLFFAFITSFFISVFSYFRFLFLLPLFYFILGISIETISKKSLRRLAILLFLMINLGSLFFFNTNKRFWREDWRSAVRFVESKKEGTTLAVMVNPAQNAGYRYYTQGIVPLIYGTDGDYTWYKTVWLFRYVQPIFDADDAVRKKIESRGFKKSGEYDFTGIVVWKYTI